MSILTTDLSSKRNQIFYTSAHRGVSHYFTDTPKMNELKLSLDDQLFFGNINPFSDILKKNLADTIVNQEQKPDMKQPTTNNNNNEYSKLSGITNFITGMFSAMFRRQKSSEGCLDDQIVPAAGWLYSKTSYKSECNSIVVKSEANTIISECKTTAETCEANLNSIRQLLLPKNLQQFRGPMKQFVDSDQVEEYFEDALSFEDCCYMPGNLFRQHYIAPKHQEKEFCEIDCPKIRLEGKIVSESMNLCGHFPTISDKHPLQNQQDNEVNNFSVDNGLDKFCNDQAEKLADYCEKGHKNNTKTSLEENLKEPANEKQTQSVPNTASKDKRFKNPTRLCSKRVKTNMKQLIEEDVLFAKGLDTDDLSRVENSPSYHSLDNRSFSPPSSNTLLDYFDEISGRFQTSDTSNDDSFEIVFSDMPKRVRSVSDCESEDSFIIFEESPDSCYTSNDVFGESDADTDSDSDTSDSGCGTMKLSQKLSQTLSDLTDHSLYDEVDCANCVPTSNLCAEDSNSELLLGDKKKTTTNDLPVKKVRFSPLPPKVHVMHVWQFAARQARAGHWERFALDRERFRRRILDTSMALSWVLQPQHRTKIMFQRFMPWWNAQKRKELAEKKEMDEAEAARRLAEEEAKKNEVEIIQRDTKNFEKQEGNSQEQNELQFNNKDNRVNVKEKNDFRTNEKYKLIHKQEDSFQTSEENKPDTEENTSFNSKETNKLQKSKKEQNKFQLNLASDNCLCNLLSSTKNQEYSLEETKTQPKGNCVQNDGKGRQCKLKRHANKKVQIYTNKKHKLLQQQNKEEHSSNASRDADKRIFKSNGTVKQRKQRKVSPKNCRGLKQITIQVLN